jgi:hypothetical protein
LVFLSDYFKRAFDQQHEFESCSLLLLALIKSGYRYTSPIAADDMTTSPTGNLKDKS